MKKLIALMLVLMLALSCVSIVACGGGGDDETQEATPGDEQETKGEETPDEETPDEGTPDSGNLEEMMGFASYDELDSFAMHMEVTTEMPEGIPGGSGGEMVIVMDEKVDNKADASYSYMDMGMFTAETITIGNETWTRSMGQQKWTYYSDEGWEDEWEDGDIDYDFTDEFDLEHDLDYKGKEKVNGVNCKKYDVEASIMVANPDPQGLVDEVESDFEGTMWVADEGKLPKVVIKMVGTSTLTTGGFETEMEYLIDVTDINKSMDIEPPPANEVLGEGEYEMPDFGDFDMPEFDMPEGWDMP